jgi:hypothetical protein
MSFDGCFPDASMILTEQEYFGKVLFDNALLQPSFRVFHWISNNKQGYIQNGDFKEKNFKWALIYEKKPDGAVAFNFGDLLVYVPVDQRLEWKKFYKGTDVQIDYADKLLFFDFETTQDREIVRVPRKTL